MLEQTTHDLTQHAASLLAIVVASRGVTVRQILDAIAIGALLAAVALVAITVLNLLNSAALWLATRRVEALTASCLLPQRERLARPFLYAFRHSTRLAQWAAIELSSSSGDQGKPNGQAPEPIEALSAAVPQTPSVACAVHPTITGVASRFFEVATIIGAVSLIVAIPIILFGPGLNAITLGSQVNLSPMFDVVMLVAMSATGIGLVGLASPILLWPLSALARRSQYRLQGAVKDCISTATNLASPLVRPKDLRTIREISQLRRLMDDERRARVENSERLVQAISHMHEISRVWQESNDVDGKGVIPAVLQLALGVALLHKRIEAGGSQQASLQISDQDRTSIATLAQSVDRLALLFDGTRNAELRMAETISKLAEVASTIERAIESFAGAPAAGDADILQPAVAELIDIMKEAVPAQNAVSLVAFGDEGGLNGE